MKHTEHYKGWDILITPEKFLAKHESKELMVRHRDSLTGKERSEFHAMGFGINIPETVHEIKPAYEKYEAVVDVLRFHNVVEQVYNLFVSHLPKVKRLIDYQIVNKEFDNDSFQDLAKMFHRFNIEFKYEFKIE